MVTQNLIPNDPSLRDLANLIQKDTLQQLNCHAIGTVQSFNPLAQTATATINYKQAFSQPNPVTGVYDTRLEDYPLLIDCPVMVLGGGNGALTFPIDTGDECLVFFNDRDIDSWFSSGGTGSTPATARLHAFPDAIIMVGIRSLPNALIDYDSSATVLRNKLGTVKVSLDDDGVIVETAAGTTVTVADGDVTVECGDLTATFSDDGSARFENPTGYFELEANADISFDTGTVTGLFGNGGKVALANATADLVTILVALLTDIQGATAGGFPLVMPGFPANLTKLQSLMP